MNAADQHGERSVAWKIQVRVPRGGNTMAG
jgi:hypothetical protein